MCQLFGKEDLTPEEISFLDLLHRTIYGVFMFTNGTGDKKPTNNVISSSGGTIKGSKPA